HYRSVLLNEALQDQVVVVALIQTGHEFSPHAVRVGTADVVTLQQDLAAPAHAHHAVPEVVESRSLVACAHEQNNNGGEHRKLEPTGNSGFPEELRHQSPAPTGAACTRARAVTRTGAALGTSAVMVPKTMMTRPIQIQGTIGLICALMIGRPVSWFRPS